MNYQFVYPALSKQEENALEAFLPEYNALKKLGAEVDTYPHKDAEQLILREFIMYEESKYPQDSRFINSWKEYNAMFRMSIYYPLIAEISIPTFFTKDLDVSVVEGAAERGWNKVFIKNDIKSLWAIDDYASVWPNHSLGAIKDNLTKCYRLNDTYAIRKFINPEVFIEEDRYWVINDKIYHRTGVIPEIVKKAAQRLSVLGSRYYAIDATPYFIVEVNPGESSDRYGDNPPELFASWFMEAFDIS